MVSQLCTQGYGDSSGPGEVLTATVINAVRQAGAGCSRGGEHLGDNAGLSCTVSVPAAGWSGEALWSLGKAQGLEYDSFKASSLLAAKSPLPVLAL